jgi:hypothetical protein
MLDAFESSIVVACSTALALLLLWRLHRVWPPQARKQHNDLIGWQIGFLATSYTVITAFMLSGVWQDYQAAEANTELEANSLILLYRVADGLPGSSCPQLKSLTRRYAESMITDEWPAMDKGMTARNGARLLQSMWKVVIQAQPRTLGEQTILNRAVTELANLAEYHRIRQHQSRSQLPRVFWLVLISGGVIIVAYTCLLGVESHRVHAMQVVTTALFISLLLVTIADVDQPFRGAIHISPDAFRLALNAFNATP